MFLGINGNKTRLLFGRDEDGDMDISLEFLFECLSLLLIEFTLRLSVAPLARETPNKAGKSVSERMISRGT